ncbi:MAG: hypothetical protein KKA42_03370 [candidate division Zixibacteria bacterium]|nr:hypothetical protein [candidate division Zixibacteria bacterium]
MPLLSQTEVKQFVLGTLSAIVITAVFVVWGETDPHSLLMASLEDRAIEYLTALFCGLSAVGFLVAMNRSRFLKDRKSWTAYIFILGWAALMFLFMGEEISWGQRLFGFSTPESIAATNTQQEFNIHNLDFVENAKYRLLSLFMLFTGVLFPAFALMARGREIIRKLAFPVMPIAYAAFFVLSYIFGKYYYGILLRDTSSEVREILMSIGMLAFGLHAALRPDDLFRLKREETPR